MEHHAAGSVLTNPPPIEDCRGCIFPARIIEVAKARMVERIAAGMQPGGAGPEDARHVQDFAAEQARVMALTDGE